MNLRWRRLTDSEFEARRPSDGPVFFSRHALMKSEDKIPFVLEIYDDTVPWWAELPVVED